VKIHEKSETEEYRAPSMTEMMLASLAILILININKSSMLKLCCRYGCSLRDLASYIGGGSNIFCCFNLIILDAIL
jgi:hypothetical protein